VCAHPVRACPCTCLLPRCALSLSLSLTPHAHSPFSITLHDACSDGGSRHHSGKDSETGKTGMPYIVRALPLSLSYPTPALKPCAVEAAAHSPGGAQEQRRALSAAMHAHGRGREL
jgi:hypothetical protein